MKYKVVVGRLGTVFEGNDPNVAYTFYAHYVLLSSSLVGLAAGETVTLFSGEEKVVQFTPPEVNGSAH